MTFQPAIPLPGVAGWRFLERTAASQKAAFDKSPMLAREVAYFKDNIGRIGSAAELVADRRLLAIALGAFGLDAEIDKRAFVRKALESEAADPKSFAGRLADGAYRKLSDAFGFGKAAGPRTASPGFADGIVDAYRIRQFESAVGNADQNLRLAMNFRREIAELASDPKDSGWFAILGSKPLRAVVEKALGLPKEFARLDIDRQREILRDKTRNLLGDGSLAAFKDAKNVEKVITRFLARAQVEAGLEGGVTSPALTLLQNAAAPGAESIFNVLASRRL